MSHNSQAREAAGRRRVEAAGDQVPEPSEEIKGGLEPGSAGSPRAISSQTCMRLAPVASANTAPKRFVDSRSSQARPSTIFLPSRTLSGYGGAHELVDEVRHADGRGAGRVGVRGDHDVAEGRDLATLGGGERERPEVAGLVALDEIGIGSVAGGRPGRDARRGWGPPRRGRVPGSASPRRSP